MEVPETSWIFLLIVSWIAAKSIDDFDPCVAGGHTVIEDRRRLSVPNGDQTSDFLCDDRLLPTWYRFVLDGSPAVIPTSCVQVNSCGTQAPVWLNLRDGNELPIYAGQEGFYLGCMTWIVSGRESETDCCLFRTSVRVRNCGNFYLYFLQPTQGCHMAYCVEPLNNNELDVISVAIPTTSSKPQLSSWQSHSSSKNKSSVAISNWIVHNCLSLANNSLCAKQFRSYPVGKLKKVGERMQDSSSGRDCPENYTADGLNCIPICKVPCSRNRVCTQPNICSCLPGYIGWHCRTAVCNPKCVNGGRCFRPNVCSCPPGFTGKFCDKVTCNFKCENGGRCIGMDTCLCKTGFTGRRCEIAFCTTNCHNGGFCAGSACDCRNGWVGPTCETPYCDPVCWNGGMCAKPGVCLCPYGFYGSGCESGLCRPPCLNGGHCVRNNVCKCPKGLIGSRCQIPICEPHCLNGGKCYKPNKCDCASGWRGKNCQIPVCVHKCANGGSCVTSNACVCQADYEGSSCKEPVCQPKCQNGGMCVAPGKCLCRPQYRGHRCKNSNSGSKWMISVTATNRNKYTTLWAKSRMKTFFLL